MTEVRARPCLLRCCQIWRWLPLLTHDCLAEQISCAGQVRAGVGGPDRGIRQNGRLGCVDGQSTAIAEGSVRITSMAERGGGHDWPRESAEEWSVMVAAP